MKKRVLAIATALMLMAAPAMGQIFLSDEDEMNYRLGTSSFDVSLPNYDNGLDHFAPLGNGIVALACLGGAYLLGKRKKKE